MAKTPVTWDLAPGEVLTTKLVSTSPLTKQVFAVISGGTNGNVPSASAIVSQRDGDLLLSQTVTPARPRTQLAWFGIDTEPNLIRHGETAPKMEFSVANPSHWPALVRFTLGRMRRLAGLREVAWRAYHDPGILPDLSGRQRGVLQVAHAQRHVDHLEWEREGTRLLYPAIRFRDASIWGLTFRVLTLFSDVLDAPLPHLEEIPGLGR